MEEYSELESPGGVKQHSRHSPPMRELSEFKTNGKTDGKMEDCEVPMYATVDDADKRSDRYIPAAIEDNDSGDDSSEPKRSLRVERVMTKKQFVAIALFTSAIIFLGITVLYGLWNHSTRSTLDDTFDKMAVELHLLTQAIVTDVFNTPRVTARIGEVAVRLVEIGRPDITNETLDWDKSDQYFVELMSLFNVSGAYLGTELGEFYGVFRSVEPENLNELLIGFLDEDSHPGSENTPGQLDDFTPEANADGVMGNTRGCYLQYTIKGVHKDQLFNENCHYFPKKRGWYKDSKQLYEERVAEFSNWDVTRDQGIWSDVYIFASETSLGITFSVPLVMKDQFVGVFAVDFTLSYLSDLLSQTPIPDNGIIYVAAPKPDGLTRVIASTLPGGVGLHFPVGPDDLGDEVLSEDPAIRSTLAYLEEQGIFNSDGENPVVQNEVVDQLYLTSAYNLDGLRGLNLMAVSIFVDEDYPALKTATILTFMPLGFVALLCAFAVTAVSYKISTLPKEVHSQSRDEAKHKRRRRYMAVLILIIVICFLTIWSVWKRQSTELVTSYIHDLITQTETRIQTTTINLIKYTQKANTLTRLKYGRGDEVWNYVDDLEALGIDTYPSETWGRYFCGVLNAFHDGNNYLIYGVMIASTDLSTFGCFNRGDEEPLLQISVLDEHSNVGVDGNHCRDRYDITPEGARDIEREIEKKRSCTYVVTSRPWFQDGIRATNTSDTRNALAFSRPYSFSSAYYIGVGAVQALWIDDKAELVFASQVKLDGLSIYLSSVDVGVTEKADPASRNDTNSTEVTQTRVYILERTIDPTRNGQNFIASSNEKVTIELAGPEKWFQTVLTAADVQEKQMRETLDFLMTKPSTDESPNWETIEGIVEIKRRLSDPLTFAIALNGEGAYGADWLSILTVPKDLFWGPVERNNRVAILAVVAAITLSLYFLSITHNKYMKKGVTKASKMRDFVTKKSINQEQVEMLMQVIDECSVLPKSTVLPCQHLEMSDDVLDDEDCQTCTENKNKNKEAFQCIFEGSHRRVNLRYYKLKSKNWAFGLFYSLKQSLLYKCIFRVVVLLHILLQFWKPARPEDAAETGFKRQMLIAEIIFIFVELIDFMFSWTALYTLKGFFTDDFKESTAVKNRHLYRAVIILMVFIDWILMVTLNFSFEYYLPFRWLIFLLSSRTLMISASSLVNAIARARDVWLMYICVLIIFMGMVITLFRALPGDDRYTDMYTDYSIDNFVFTFITGFFYITTGHNYPFVANTVINGEAVFFLFFVLFIIFGTIFTMGLLVGYFAFEFKDAQRQAKEFDRFLERIGVISAFLILADDSHAPFLSHATFRTFQRYCGSTTGESGKMTDSLSVFEFFTLIEKITPQKLIHDRKKKQSALRNFDLPGNWDDALRHAMVQNWWRQAILAIIIIHTFLVMLYGSIPETAESVVDYILGASVMLQTLDIVMQYVVFGPGYWNWLYFPRHWDTNPQHPSAKNRKEAYHQMLGNRFEVVVIAAAFLGWTITHALDGGLKYSSDVNRWRFFAALPMLRLLSQVKRTRVVIITLFKVLPTFSSLFATLLMALYIFAVYGTTFLGGGYELLSLEGPPDSNYDSLLRSLMTLFEFLITPSIFVMGKVIQHKGLAAALFFIAYTIVVIVLFRNLFVGMILGTVGGLLHSDDDEDEFVEDETSETKQVEDLLSTNNYEDNIAGDDIKSNNLQVEDVYNFLLENYPRQEEALRALKKACSPNNE